MCEIQMKAINRKKNRLADLRDDAVFLGPALALFIPVVVLPFFYAIFISFTQWDGISSQITWNGLFNFTKIFTRDTDFKNSIFLTVKLTVLITVLSNVLGLTFASLLTKPLKVREFGRTAFILPNIMSGVILGYIWQFIFTRGFPALGELLNMPFFNQGWLGTPETAFWGIVIVCVWQWSGYTMIIYIAGINSIGKDVWEAASLDGATGLQRFFRVTLPLIMPSVTICLFWTLARSFMLFDLPYSLTGGGPYRTTETIAMNIYYEAFTKNNYGMGSAKSMIFFVGVLIISRLQVYFTRKQEVDL